jgi:hypothetical protein
MRPLYLFLLIPLAAACTLRGRPLPAQPGARTNPYAAWKLGPPADPGYFPIAVWLQDPLMAARYRQAGINLYVGLWKGPTEEQLARLKAAGMQVICDQNEVGLRHRDDPTIAGWMHGDEPDNAQPLPGGRGYGGPVPHEKIVADYQRIRRADSNRPVMLNLGQGVANDQWIGRGAKVEDYPRYCEGCDIVSFDVYPVAGLDKPQSEDPLWYVPKGVDRLRNWTGDRKLVWNCIECTQISKPGHKATPEQVRTEVWMSLIHGSRGLIYFVHQFKPAFDEHALLDDPAMLAAVTALNRQIRDLAPALNSPTVPGGVTVTASNSEAPVDAVLKRTGGTTYLFAVGMRSRAGHARFAVKGLEGSRKVRLLGENRTLEAKNGAFEDDFAPFAVHLYRID